MMKGLACDLKFKLNIKFELKFYAIAIKNAGACTWHQI